jgi:signal transduction histidine kinase
VTFRNRLFLTFGGIVIIPLGVLLLGVRAEVGKRISDQFADRVKAMAGVTRADLEARGRSLGDQLNAMVADLGSDNRFRIALHTPQDRRYLLDYAGQAMRRAGLGLLQVQDTSGRILSSGHFRNEYDRSEAPLARLLARAPGKTAMVRVRIPEGTLTALARADSLTIAGDQLFLVVGAALPAGPDVAYVFPGDSIARRGDSVATASFNFPFIDATVDSPADTAARVVVSQSTAPLLALRRNVDRWFVIAGALTLVLALTAAGWITGRLSSPLSDLAEKTARIDLDRLDVSFDTDGEDEIGALSRLMDQMTQRLRTSMVKLREAERRATVGDLARQLNHDVKNGLVPVRNVFRHLAQVARDEPEKLPAVLLERQKTIEAGISYLENLARNYARLSPSMDRQPCDLNATVGEFMQGVASGRAEIRLDLAPSLPAVAADPLVIRRILENLVSNAVDSLDGGEGIVTVATSNGAIGTAGNVRLTVADQGKGMTQQELERAFEDFYTTKPGGTGLGLSIVRRLVLDLHGDLRVETAQGSGTRFLIDLPTAERPSESAS